MLMTFPKCKLSVTVLLCFSALHRVYERAWYTLGQISKWICTTISSEIGMKPEEALTTDGISTPLHAIQIVWWTLHKNRCTRGSQTHAHTFRGGLVAVISDLDVSGHAVLLVPTGHAVSKCHTLGGGLKTPGLEVEATGWKQEAQAISVRNTQKQRWSVLFAPRTKSERQRPSHYFRICGRQQTLRATNTAFTITYWGMRREANVGENIVYYWKTSGNGVLSVFFCFGSSKKITLNV